MKTPAFRYMGGKARLRKWLMGYFPVGGNRYIEPFAGRGNVYFLSRQKLNFKEWYLSDIDAQFLHSLKAFDAQFLPINITQEDFNYYKRGALDSDDFVYFDPPYYGTKANYPNIDHEKLIKVLNGANFRWAISGYDNELYANTLKFTGKHQIERNSEIRGSNSRGFSPVTETLWLNYET